MAYYDSDSFTQMQRDALRRMEEMQSRAKVLPEEDKKPPQSAESKAVTQVLRTAEQSAFRANPLGSLDPEKLLILLMLFILYKNKADPKLLLALGYLLL